ncbi:MAG TPA: DUF6624 domain-containing protein [Gemmatimonadaceae bacterium]|nr:DUF6624 domain-containing protein [Gemmatimonadaceae bacterium]
MRARAALAMLALVAAPAMLGTLASPAAAQQSPADSIATACMASDTATAWRRVSAAWSDERGHTWSNDSLRRRLIALGERDQAVRNAPALADSMRDPAFVRRMAERDSADAAELRAIIDRYGWPGRSLVGARGASAAFLVAQHNPALQHEALRLMQALPAGEVSPSDLAMLEDRVRVSDGRPQRYGTQLHDSGDGRTLVFDPIEDLAHLDERRAAAGLPPLPVYLCIIRGLSGREVQPPAGYT